jgi:hypothetical protein
MALLYVFIINNPSPNTVKNLPPSVINSEWEVAKNSIFENLASLTNRQINRLDNNKTRFAAILEDETALANLNASLQPSDEIKTAIQEWATAHSITFEHKVYELPSASVTLPNWI